MGQYFIRCSGLMGVVLQEKETGRQIDPVLVDRSSGEPITETTHVLVQRRPAARTAGAAKAS